MARLNQQLKTNKGPHKHRKKCEAAKPSPQRTESRDQGLERGKVPVPDPWSSRVDFADLKSLSSGGKTWGNIASGGRNWLSKSIAF